MRFPEWRSLGTIKLMSETRRVARQHLISQVLLRRFTMPGTKGSGWQVAPFDLNNPDRHHKLRSPRECGWVEDFVAFDSGSVEELWGSVERRAPEAFAAIDSGTPFDNPDHTEILRDLVVLHLVRSHRYRDVYLNSVTKAREKVRRGLIQDHSEALGREALRQTGLHLTGPQALGRFADRLIASTEPTQDHASGKLFRTSIEDMFRKVQAKVSSWQLELLTPQEGQFLVSDTPAITLRRDGNYTRFGMAVGDADTIMLPLDPYHLVALGPENRAIQAPKTLVDELNGVQVLAANQYIYMHPRSGLEAFVRDGLRYRSGR